MKQLKILTNVFPLRMARIANQIVTVCACLANFQPALVSVGEIQETDNSDTSDSDNESVVY